MTRNKLTKKQQLFKDTTDLAKDIRYWNQYPYTTWLGRLISKGIVRNLKRRLEGKENQLLSILEGEKKKRQNQK